MSNPEHINGDMSEFVSVDTNKMKWQPSPSGTYSIFTKWM